MTQLTDNQVITRATNWFQSKGWTPFPFQKKTWQSYLAGKSGIVNAATGSGKTYSLVVPIVLEYLQNPTADDPLKLNSKGLRAIWITPVKALAKEIQSSAQAAVKAFNLNWNVAIRTGDTPTNERAKQKRRPPEILITTPESLHLLLASNGYEKLFANLQTIVADEWHELVGSKRGVQVELALSRLKSLLPKLKVWGISATIGNMDEAAAVLFGEAVKTNDWQLIRSDIQKKIVLKTVLPDTIERFPWAGHLGIKLLEKTLQIVHESKTTLLFTNTRRQCELWYHAILEKDPDLAGLIAMHHSAIAKEQREWVEEALHSGTIKLAVCTSSLDLGVDFRPVETVIQIGSPKGVARFLQRAGRSGHQPGATSTIHFVPAHALELVEAAALRAAVKNNYIESRIPYIRSFDVLVQYLVTLSISGGFDEKEIFNEVKETFSYASLNREEWQWCLAFITTGGGALDAYDEYNRVGIYEGRHYIMNKSLATRHRLSMGTIVSNTMLEVKYKNGKKIGSVEERFVGSLSKGDTFMFSGRFLEVVRVRGMVVTVKNSRKKKGNTPSWQGGRMPLSSELSAEIRKQMSLLQSGEYQSAELQKLEPLTQLQNRRSHLPAADELLVEYFQDREGYHLVIYPFDGRFVHEGMSTLIAARIGQLKRISFSISVNDYGFELLSDLPLNVDKIVNKDLFSTKNLWEDVQNTANTKEMARRKFRDIASIAGLVFKGFPGRQKRDRHLQASAGIFFDVFQDYDSNNLLLQQAYEEVLQFQLEETRLRHAFERILSQKIVITKPNKATPFAFPLVVDRIRASMSSERLEDRIKKMKLQLIK
ncbi:MAG: ligase-associated DNA damage response DEXH box helicase [Saprospiraceae bacterium]